MKIKKIGKKGSFSKTLNNNTTFVKKVPKMPKGETNIGSVVAKAEKKKGGNSTNIIIRTTSAKWNKSKKKVPSGARSLRDLKKTGINDNSNVAPPPPYGEEDEGPGSD